MGIVYMGIGITYRNKEEYELIQMILFSYGYDWATTQTLVNSDPYTLCRYDKDLYINIYDYERFIYHRSYWEEYRDSIILDIDGFLDYIESGKLYRYRSNYVIPAE